MMRGTLSGLMLIILLFGHHQATAYTVEPNLTVKYGDFNVDQQRRVEGLEEMLYDFLENWDDPDGDDYDITIPVTMQINLETTAPQGTVYRYTATFFISDQAEFQYTDARWQYLMAEYEEIGRHSGFHSFTSFIEFYMNILVAHQIDKLECFAGDHWMEKAMRIAQDAKFDQNELGWYERNELIESLLSEDMELQRTLSWTYHVALYFDEVVENEYEAWNAAALCVDILEELPEGAEKRRFLEFSYYKLGNILKKGGDSTLLERMIRMDRSHEDYYYRLIDGM